MVTDQVVFLETMIDLYSGMDPDFETKLQEVKDQMAGRLIVSPPSEEIGTPITEALEKLFNTDGLAFTEVTKEGEIVRGMLDMNAYFDEVPELKESIALYPEGTDYRVVYEVDVAEQTLTSITTIDVPEQEKESTEDTLEGVSVAQLLSASETVVMARPTNETAPTIDELDTMTMEEFNQILIDVGIEKFKNKSDY